MFISIVSPYILRICFWSDETGDVGANGRSPLQRMMQNLPLLTPPAREGKVKGDNTREWETKGEATSPSLVGRGKGG